MWDACVVIEETDEEEPKSSKMERSPKQNSSHRARAIKEEPHSSRIQNIQFVEVTSECT